MYAYLSNIPHLYCIALHCIALYCIVLYCILLYFTVFYCIVLYCIALHCITLHCSYLARLRGFMLHNTSFTCLDICVICQPNRLMCVPQSNALHTVTGTDERESVKRLSSQCYFMPFSIVSSWTQAQTQCQHKGANLISINDRYEASMAEYVSKIVNVSEFLATKWPKIHSSELSW